MSCVSRSHSRGRGDLAVDRVGFRSVSARDAQGLGRKSLYASADGGRSWIDRGSVVDGGTFVDDPYMALGAVTASISNPKSGG